MGVEATGSGVSADVAVGRLGAPISGHDFSLSSTTPRRGQLVLALGYALGQPLSLNEGHVAGLRVTDRVRLLELDLLETNGASGGPILNAAGQVVAITQYGPPGGQQSVDLAHLTDGDPSAFCFGIAQGQLATICPARSSSRKVLSQVTSVPTCDGIELDPPFLPTCPTLPGLGQPTPQQTPTTPGTTSQIPQITDCWVSSTASSGASTKVSTVIDAHPPLYFVTQLNEAASPGVMETLTLTSPDTVVSSLLTNQSLAGFGNTFVYGPVPWVTVNPDALTDGTWTFNEMLSSGASCSYQIKLEPAPGP
jgi:hypothetical protein